MPPLIEIGSSLQWLFGLFLTALIIFHLWLVYLKPIGEISWKRVDYIWLSIAILGLVGQAAQVRQLWYTSAYETSHYRVEGALSSLKQRANFSTSSSICRTFVRTSYSPENFDKIQAEYNFACSKFKNIVKDIESADQNHNSGFFTLSDTSQIRSQLTEQLLLETLTRLESAHNDFLHALEEQSVSKSNIQSTIGEFLLIILSPFLLIFALALRITKVTGEIRLKRSQL